jgi:hypothetical protein
MIKCIIFDWGGVLANSDSTTVARILSKKHSYNVFKLKYDLNIYQKNYQCNSSDEEFFSIIYEKFKIPKSDV